MSQVLQFRRQLSVFYPDTTAAMGKAFDEAIARFDGGESESVLEDVIRKADNQIGAIRRSRS
jgi:hypothetical protein